MLYIHGVGVHADYRRQGIGKQTMVAVKQLCKLSGMGKMFLYTPKTDTAARALYDSVEGTVDRDGSTAVKSFVKINLLEMVTFHSIVAFLCLCYNHLSSR